MEIVTAALKVVGDLVAFFGPMVGLIGGALGVTTYVEARRPIRPALNVAVEKSQTLVEGKDVWILHASVLNSATEATLRWNSLDVAGEGQLCTPAELRRPIDSSPRIQIKGQTVVKRPPHQVKLEALSQFDGNVGLLMGPKNSSDRAFGLLARPGQRKVKLRFYFSSDSLGGYNGWLSFVAQLAR